MLRDYQQEDFDKCKEALQNGKNRNLIVWSTGAGKTVLLSHLVGLLSKKRSLIIVNREELVFQTVEKVNKYFKNINHRI